MDELVHQERSRVTQYCVFVDMTSEFPLSNSEYLKNKDARAGTFCILVLVGPWSWSSLILALLFGFVEKKKTPNEGNF